MASAGKGGRRSAAEERDLKARILSHLADGKTIAAIAEEEDVQERVVRQLRDAIFEDVLEDEVGSSPAEVWVAYRLRQESVIASLDGILEVAKGSKSGNVMAAAVSAAKAKAQLLDAILEKGQSLGVLHKEPAKTMTVNGVPIEEVKDGELERLLEDRRKHFEEMITRFGVENYADEDDGDLYAHSAASREKAKPEGRPLRRKAVH